MPKETYFNLPKQKKERVYKASLEEFVRVPFEEVSIKNIVEQAHIPRGSFYQYFEDKKDLFIYILNETKANIEELNIKFDDNLEQVNIFEYLLKIAKLQIDDIIQQTNGIRSYRAKLLTNIIKSPIAKNIFQAEIKFNFKQNHLFSNLKNVSDAKHLNEKQITGLIDLLVYIMTQSIMTVLHDNSLKNNAIEELEIKLNLIKNGVDLS